MRRGVGHEPREERVDCCFANPEGGAWFVSVCDEQCCLVDGSEHHVCEQGNVAVGESAMLGKLFEVALEPAERVALVDLAPARPADDRWRVDEDDLLDRGIECHPQPGPAADPQALDGITRGAGSAGDPRCDLLDDAVEDGIEQCLLALEVVVEGAALDASRAKDRVE